MLESKRKAIIFIVISFVLAVVAGFLTLQKVSALNEDLGGMTEIYVAATDIPSRTIIKPEHLETMKIPKGFLVENSHFQTKDSSELVNKVLVVPISKGSLLTKEIIKPVSEALDKDNRLVAIPKTGNIIFDREDIHSLDRVDIVVSHNFEKKAKTEIFMKDVLVFSSLKNDKGFAGIMVEVSIDEAPKIIHMQNYADSMRILKASVGKEVEAKTEEKVKKEEVVEKEEKNEQKEQAELQEQETETKQE